MSADDIKTTIVCSDSFNPWFNLALEEYLLHNVSDNEVILYLWQNENTVVIGCNQNPWKECKYKELEKDGGKLARRLSGGGAVFHDLGNLNFTFIANKNLYNLEKQLSVILNAVKAYGINATFSGRNDIEIEGKKFSGNAFYFGDKSNYHHGTILIDVDLNKLSKYLQVSTEKISSKGIDSVKARVVNLNALNDEITISSMKNSLKVSFKELYGGDCEEFILDEQSFNLKDMCSKYCSWQWRFSESPFFDIELKNRFTWGEIQFHISLKKAHIDQINIYSDSLDTKIIPILKDKLKGIPFDLIKIAEVINAIDLPAESKVIQKDLCNWFISKASDL